MICEKCQTPIDPGEEHELHGQTICEDCYIDGLSPTRTCDPWAVHRAKSFTQEDGQGPELNPAQRDILDLLRREGPLAPPLIIERLGLTARQLEREVATLRHLEMVRGALTQEGVKVVRLW